MSGSHPRSRQPSQPNAARALRASRWRCPGLGPTRPSCGLSTGIHHRSVRTAEARECAPLAHTTRSIEVASHVSGSKVMLRACFPANVVDRASGASSRLIRSAGALARTSERHMGGEPSEKGRSNTLPQSAIIALRRFRGAPAPAEEWRQCCRTRRAHAGRRAAAG